MKNEKNKSLIERAANALYLYQEKLNKWLEKSKYNLSYGDNEKDLVSLREYIEIIQKVYSSFKEEYEDIEKLNIGKYNNVLFYCDADDSKFLELQINEQEKDSIVPEDYGYCCLIMGESKGTVYAYFRKDDMIGSPSIDIKVDPEIIREYLRVFGKYYALFETFKEIIFGKCICSKHNQHLYLKTDTPNDSLIDDLDGIVINLFTDNFMSDNYSVELYVDLSDGIKIDYEKSHTIENNTRYGKAYMQDGLLEDWLDDIKVDYHKLPNYKKLEELAKEKGKTK